MAFLLLSFVFVVVVVVLSVTVLSFTWSESDDFRMGRCMIAFLGKSYLFGSPSVPFNNWCQIIFIPLLL